MRIFAHLAALLALALMTACGDEKAPTNNSPASKVVNSNVPAPETAVKAPSADPAVEPVKAARPMEISWKPTAANAVAYQGGPGAVTAKAVFKGDAIPKRKKIDQSKDPKCANEKPLTDEEVVNKENKGIKNVFFFVKSGHENQKFSAPDKAVELHQTGCIYEPHVFGLMPGQKITIVNDDDTTHNVHGLPTKSKEFNFTQNKKGQKDDATIENGEYPVKIKCDIHPWMGAWAFVLPHTLFAVSDANGDAKIANLPAGNYEIASWHEVYGEGAVQKVTVADKDVAISVEFKK